MATCPFGEDVDEPPSLLHCPISILECPCAHHMMRYAFGIPSDRSMAVVAFWQQHPNPPKGSVSYYDEEDEEVDR